MSTDSAAPSAMSDSTHTAASFDEASVRSAVELAARAPSIHNTQPWLWRLGPEGLQLRADPERRLDVADPDGHSMRISCGAALALTELGLRAAGWLVQITRLPDHADPDLLALLQPAGRQEPDHDVLARAAAARRRQSDRRPFDTREVEPGIVEALRAAAGGAGVHADFPDRPEQRVNLAVAVGWADRIERNDAAYVAEMNRWLRDSDVHAGGLPGSASSDGIPSGAIPQVAADSPRHTDVPVRDFEIGVSGRELIRRDVDERPLIAVLLTESDMPEEQLRAGEAMMRFMIEAELAGVASCPLSQAVDLVAFRSRLKTLMGWQGFPQMMLRLGYPVAELPATARTPRRAVADVLHVG